jgi:hypothetical protein
VSSAQAAGLHTKGKLDDSLVQVAQHVAVVATAIET